MPQEIRDKPDLGLYESSKVSQLETWKRPLEIGILHSRLGIYLQVAVPVVVDDRDVTI